MNVIIANKYQELLVNLDIDVIKSMSGEFSADDIIATFSHFFFNKMILDITAIKDYKNIEQIQKLSMSLDMNKVILLLDDSPESMTPEYLSKLISMGIYNFTKSVDNIKFLVDNPNTYKDVAQYHKLSGGTVTSTMEMSSGSSIIIGIKNVTQGAGATSLIYMMKKQLSLNYNVLAIEIDKSDFMFFNDSTLVSTSHEEFPKIIMKNSDKDIVLVDLNNSNDEDTCTDIVYLMEPSTIKLNKMIRKNRNVFEKLRGKKIVLNKSLLDNKDVSDFEYESRSEVFYNLPPLDDKINRHRVLDDYLSKLGFLRQKGDDVVSDGSGSSILGGLFGKK